MDKIYDRWYKSGKEKEDIMESSHKPFWNKILRYLKKEDIVDKDILDFGCNQGGFLRHLYKKYKYKSACGTDLGSDSIKTAVENKKDEPVEYINTPHPNKLDKKFDTAISTAVIYLIKDINEHADIIYNSLKENGVYYASHGDYVSLPNLCDINKYIQDETNLTMNLFSMDMIADAFFKRGFSVSIIRMIPDDFVEIFENDRWNNYSVKQKLKSVYEESYLFRFQKIK